MPDAIRLWKQFVNGDAASFEQIYRLYFQDLTRYAGRIRNDENFVSEVIQDLFVKLWQNRASLSEPESVRHYLLRSCRNTALNKLQGNNRETLVESWEDQSVNVDVHQADDDSESHEVDLSALTDRQREAIHLFYYQNLSYQEISELLGIQIGATYKLVYRALEVLRAGSKNSV